MMSTRAQNMPRIDDAAWHGPIGEAVQRLAPTTEADPVGVLAISLALVGAVIGDGPHIRLGGVNHPAKLWPLVIGSTGAGRKGTAQASATYFASSLISHRKDWLKDRTKTGLSTGEGLIAALKPPSDPEDDRPADGRLVVVEPEFGRVLAVMKRDGATLGPILRSLWDSDRAAVMTRGEPLAVNGTHLIVIGHVSPRELRLKLAEADIAGGTVNRLLPILAERAHLLPIEPELPDISTLARKVGEAIRRRPAGLVPVSRTTEADSLWCQAYKAMASDEADGLLGSILARGPAQSMRLALTYALADGEQVIGIEHMRAGLAVWQYAADSAHVVFGDVSGVSDLDRLADFLASASGGRTATDVSRLFGRHKTANDLRLLVQELIDRGDVVAAEDHSGRGRPVTRYRWIGVPRTSLAEVLAGMPLSSELREIAKEGAA